MCSELCSMIAKILNSTLNHNSLKNLSLLCARFILWNAHLLAVIHYFKPKPFNFESILFGLTFQYTICSYIVNRTISLILGFPIRYDGFVEESTNFQENQNATQTLEKWHQFGKLMDVLFGSTMCTIYSSILVFKYVPLLLRLLSSVQWNFHKLMIIICGHPRLQKNRQSELKLEESKIEMKRWLMKMMNYCIRFTAYVQ